MASREKPMPYEDAKRTLKLLNKVPDDDGGDEGKITSLNEVDALLNQTGLGSALITSRDHEEEASMDLSNAPKHATTKGRKMPASKNGEKRKKTRKEPKQASRKKPKRVPSLKKQKGYSTKNIEICMGYLRDYAAASGGKIGIISAKNAFFKQEGSPKHAQVRQFVTSLRNSKKCPHLRGGGLTDELFERIDREEYDFDWDPSHIGALYSVEGDYYDELLRLLKAEKMRRPLDSPRLHWDADDGTPERLKLLSKKFKQSLYDQQRRSGQGAIATPDRVIAIESLGYLTRARVGFRDRLRQVEQVHDECGHVRFGRSIFKGISLWRRYQVLRLRHPESARAKKRPLSDEHRELLQESPVPFKSYSEQWQEEIDTCAQKVADLEMAPPKTGYWEGVSAPENATPCDPDTNPLGGYGSPVTRMATMAYGVWVEDKIPSTAKKLGLEESKVSLLDVGRVRGGPFPMSALFVACCKHYEINLPTKQRKSYRVHRLAQMARDKVRMKYGIHYFMTRRLRSTQRRRIRTFLQSQNIRKSKNTYEQLGARHCSDEEIKKIGELFQYGSRCAQECTCTLNDSVETIQVKDPNQREMDHMSAIATLVDHLKEKHQMSTTSAMGIAFSIRNLDVSCFWHRNARKSDIQICCVGIDTMSRNLVFLCRDGEHRQNSELLECCTKELNGRLDERLVEVWDAEKEDYEDAIQVNSDDAKGKHEKYLSKVAKRHRGGCVKSYQEELSRLELTKPIGLRRLSREGNDTHDPYEDEDKQVWEEALKKHGYEVGSDEEDDVGSEWEEDDTSSGGSEASEDEAD